MSPLLAILAFQAVVIEPAKDPNFAKPITVRLPFAALREVATALSKATGQPIDISGTVADWKATVLVKDLPAGRTMEALADALGLVWKKDGPYYRLSRADGSASAESAYIASERQAREKGNPPLGETPTVTFGVPVQNSARPARNGRRPGGARPKMNYVRFDPNLLNFEGAGKPPTRLEPAVVSGTSEFAAAVAAWPSIPKDLDPVWNKSIASTNPTPSTWENGRFVLGDLLVAWHDATGLPVVADAFRLPMKSTSVRPGTALSSLQALSASERLSFRLADGVARFRHPAFWRLREQEVPEYEWNVLEKGQPTIDSFALFASHLKTPQIAAFRSQESPMSHVRSIAVRESYPALMLWNALPSAARRTILAGTPIGISAVRNATNAYVYALREAPYYDAGDPTDVLAMQASELGIFGKSSGKTVELRLSGERGGGVSYLVELP